MAKSRVLVGAQCVVLINGVPFGKVADFSYSSETPSREIYCVDQIEMFEAAPMTAKINGGMTIYRLSGDGGAEGVGLTVSFPELSRAKYFSLSILDRSTSQIIFKANKCFLTSQAWSLPSRGIITGHLAFGAITWSNEVGAASGAS